MGTQTAITHTEGPPRLVGHVYASIRISNTIDLADERRGLLAPSAVRSIHLDDVLVDTGASHLCLPREIVERLGLDFIEDVQVTTASGDGAFGLYDSARIEISGRAATLQCIALPAGSQPLLGVLPLEQLGLEPDLANQRLRVLPRKGKDTHILLY